MIKADSKIRIPPQNPLISPETYDISTRKIINRNREYGRKEVKDVHGLI